LPATLHGQFTQAVYQDRPIDPVKATIQASGSHLFKLMLSMLNLLWRRYMEDAIKYNIFPLDDDLVGRYRLTLCTPS
jgi:hypothetical protein